MRFLEDVRLKVQEQTYEHSDVKWLLQEVDRYRGIDIALMEVIGDRNQTIAVLNSRLAQLDGEE
jgi:hypothetical protein